MGEIRTEVPVTTFVLSNLMVPSYVTRITPITILTPHHHRSYPGVSAARPRPPRPARLGSRRWPPRRRHPAADRESKVCGPVDFLPCSWWGPPGGVLCTPPLWPLGDFSRPSGGGGWVGGWVGWGGGGGEEGEVRFANLPPPPRERPGWPLRARGAHLRFTIGDRDPACGYSDGENSGLL